MFTNLVGLAMKELGAANPAPGAWLYNGDALKLMAALPTGCGDLAAVDPPYFLSNGGTTNHGGKRVSVDKGDWDASASLKRDHDFTLRWLCALQRVVHPNGSVWVSGTYHNIFSVGYAMQSLRYRMLNLVTWEKPNPPPNLGCRTFTHSTEMLAWAAPMKHDPMRHTFNYDRARELNGGVQMKDVWRFTAPSGDEKELGRHPAQKPLALLERMIELTSAPGSLVIDPFAGSATTGVAALKLGRVFVGAELDPEHYHLAVKRLASAAG